MFTPDSRYANAGTYEVTLPDGSVVTVTRAPAGISGPIVGWHPRLDGDRLDLLAHRFFRNATQGWLLCEANNTMVPDALAARELIAVPRTEG
jgi:hypothetical protein